VEIQASDIDAVSKVLGHASIETTRIYTAKARSQLAQTINSIATGLLQTQSTWAPSQDMLRRLKKP
jgi:hypothetical protein